MSKNRVTPEPGTLVEYASVVANRRYQVYFLTGNTYVCHIAHEWSSDAFDAARDLVRQSKLCVKVFDAVAHKWIVISR